MSWWANWGWGVRFWRVWRKKSWGLKEINFHSDSRSICWFRKQFGSSWDTISSIFHHNQSWHKMQRLRISSFVAIFAAQFFQKPSHRSSQLILFFQKFTVILSICYLPKSVLTSTFNLGWKTKHDRILQGNLGARRTSLFKITTWVSSRLDCAVLTFEFHPRCTFWNWINKDRSWREESIKEF